MKIPFSFNPLGASKDSGGGMPTNGLTFYHPLNAYTLDPAVGNTLTLTGNAPTATTFNGIDCLQFSNGALIQDGIDGYINFTDPEVTMSIWANTAYNWINAGVFAIGDWGYCASLEIMKQYRFKLVTDPLPERWLSDNIVTGKWYHLAITFSKSDTNNIVKIYRDGTFITQYTESGNEYNIAKCLGIGRNFDISGYPNLRDTWFPGYLAGARLYNRALSDEEIALLATELTPHYQITASDLSFSLYQKNESYRISFTSPGGQPTFEIIEGELPSTISFNTSNGQFYGKGLTDADHTYNLKVRVTAPNSDPATCNVTIYTYKTARISLYNQTFSFISNKAESKSISYTSDESVTFTVESGTLPAGMTMTTGGTFSSSGANTSADNQQVVVRATSANNQTGVTATMTLDMQMNAVVLNAQTFKFYTAQGTKTKTVNYSGSLNTVSDAVFSMTGTLPTGVTWDATTGSFTSDGTQSADETASVSVTVSSANGTSTAATATVTLEVHLGEPAVLNDMIWYLPFEDSLKEEVNDIAPSVNGTGFYEFAEKDSIPCVKCSSTGYSSEFFDYGETSKTILDIGTGDFSVSFWMAKNTLRWDGNSANQIVIFGTQTSDFSTGLTLYQDGGNAGIDARISPGQSPLCIDNFSSTTAMPDENWHFWTFTRSGNTVKWYTDEVEVSVRTRVHGNTTNAECLFTPSMNFRIGYGQWSNCRPNYYLAALRIYDRVLDDSEIAVLAAEFTPTPSA